jgi:Domain of unknown function (DUF4936)
MLQVYIYFRSPVAQRAAVASTLAQLQLQLAASAGVAGRVLIKREATPRGVDAGLTWMEIYENVGADQLESFLAALNVGCSSSGLAALLSGKRHVEVFESVPTETAHMCR